MSDIAKLKSWFCNEILPLESSLTHYISRNWRSQDDVVDIRQDVYEAVLAGARNGLPVNCAGYVFTIARNILINRAKRGRVVRFEQLHDIDVVDRNVDLLASDRHIDARDALRRAHDGLSALPPRCREVVRLRKVEGLSTRETADRMGIGLDTVERQLVLGLRAMTDAMLGGNGRIRRGPSTKARKEKAR
ncbi:RNA polymerase sigma-70 factor (ECF subfamily) [Sphingomonas insulae]|uniref:RNA polymerase sigma factor n=1 Tax=Sphingomonas insulae TaxID=424800 RepID=UPI001ABB977E|nr:RNA polymerase sigma factor [Sphingomonas insulae]NIJ29637.1 RNA polymerase sigma-70 factor (ECF subfamily) [Sphingomonas insulae]